MECPSCHFENIPGLEKCFNCGTLLEPPKDESFEPPRASAAAKPARLFKRAFRRTLPASYRVGSQSIVERLANEAPIAALLSIVPGLAQLLQRRYGTIWMYHAGYCLSLLVALALTGTMFGTFMLISSLTLHAWILLESMQALPELQFRQRFAVSLGLSALFAYVYIGLIWHGVFGLNVRQSAAAIPAEGITTHRPLLMHELGNDALERGEIVTVPMQRLTNHGRIDARGFGAAQIIGLPNETITLIDGQYFADEKPLPADIFAPPTNLVKRNGEIALGADEYFLNIRYNLAGMADTAQIMRMCTVPRNEITEKMWLKLPLWSNFSAPQNRNTQ